MNNDTDRGGPLWAWLELLRLPNIFTAVADVTMGFLVVQVAAEGQRTWQIQPAGAQILLLLVAASSLLYAAGVVLNDVFDLETDRQDRPERPIPSGRVSLRAARRAGWLLLAAGVALAWIVTFHEGRSAIHPPLAPDDENLEVVDDSHAAGNLATLPWVERFRPGLIGVLLAAAVVLYDAGLKRTPLGPVGMGACRMFNVLLGMSVLAGPFQPEHFLIAGGIGVYVAGITWLARNENRPLRPPANSRGRAGDGRRHRPGGLVAPLAARLEPNPGPVLLVLVHGAPRRDDPLAVLVRRDGARDAARANGRHSGHPVDRHVGCGRMHRRSGPLALGRRALGAVGPRAVLGPLVGKHVRGKGLGIGGKAEGGGRKAVRLRFRPRAGLRLRLVSLPPSAFRPPP